MTTSDDYEQVERRYTDDHWRATTYEGPNAHRVHVALPPRTHYRTPYDDGSMFLDHWSWDEDAERSMLTSLVGGTEP